MHFKGLAGKDTLHVVVNHWPSRSAGQLESEPNRIRAAKTLRSKVDSLFRVSVNSYIIITGDFNDTPDDVSLTNYLEADTELSYPLPGALYNLSSDTKKKGTIKYQGNWMVFDQFIVSGAFFDKSNSLETSRSDYRILDEKFLLTNDQSYTGKRPFRTYMGYRYEGGFSDHLPVYIDIY